MTSEETRFDAARRRERKITWERRFQSVMLSMAVAGIVWFGNSIVSLRELSAGQTVQLMSIQVAQARAAVEVATDKTQVLSRVDSVERRVLFLEGYHRADPGMSRTPEK